MFDRFTDAARRSVVMAQAEARIRSCPSVQVDHLALGALRFAAEDPGAAPLIAGTGLEVAEVVAAIEPDAPSGNVATEGKIPFDAATQAVLAQSAVEAQGLGHRHIGTEHLLLAVLSAPASASARVLVAAGATHDAMVAALRGAAAPGFQVKTTRGLGRFRKGGGGPG